MTSIELLDSAFATLPDLVRAHAAERPDAVAAADPARRLSWSELDQMVDRIAARLQQDGLAKGDRTAIAGLNSVEQMAVILGTLRAGGVAGLITNSATGEQMAAMIADGFPGPGAEGAAIREFMDPGLAAVENLYGRADFDLDVDRARTWLETIDRRCHELDPRVVRAIVAIEASGEATGSYPCHWSAGSKNVGVLM